MEADARELRVDRSVLSVAGLHDADDRYWLSRSIDERLEAIEIQRQIVYGYGPVAPRIERVLEVVPRRG